MSSTPAGWSKVRLADLGEWFGGSTPAKSNAEYWHEGTVPWLSPKDMSTDRIVDTADHVTPTALAETSLRVLPAPAVVVVTRSGILERTLPVATTAVELSTNQDMKALVPHPHVDAEWLAYYLRANTRRILEACRKSGTTVASLDFKLFLDLKVDLPPLTEQRRVVAKLDLALPELRRLSAELSAIDNRLAAYTKLMINSFLQGRRSLATATPAEVQPAPVSRVGVALRLGLRNAGTGPATQPPNRPIDAPAHWGWVTWEQVGLAQNGTAFPSGDYSSSGIRLLRPGNLHASGQVEWTAGNSRWLPERYGETHDRYLVGPGQLLMNLTAQSLADEFLGRVCMTSSAEEPCLLNQRIARLVPIEIHPRFAYYVFKSGPFRQFVDAHKSGSLIRHLHTRHVNKFPFLLPPWPEQVCIAQQLDNDLEQVGRLRADIAQLIKQLKAAHDAVLQAATTATTTATTKDLDD